MRQSKKNVLDRNQILLYVIPVAINHFTLHYGRNTAENCGGYVKVVKSVAAILLP